MALPVGLEPTRHGKRRRQPCRPWLHLAALPREQVSRITRRDADGFFAFISWSLSSTDKNPSDQSEESDKSDPSD